MSQHSIMNGLIKTNQATKSHWKIARPSYILNKIKETYLGVKPKAVNNTYYRLPIIKDANDLDVNQTGLLSGYPVKRLNINNLKFRYFMPGQDGYLNYTKLLSVGTFKNYIAFSKYNSGDFHKITNAFMINKNGYKKICYEYKCGGYNYYVSGNPKNTDNAFFEPKDLKKLGRHSFSNEMIIIEPCYEYPTPNSNFREGRLTHGFVVNAEKLVPTKMTPRLKLTDGNYITANKCFVRLG